MDATYSTVTRALERAGLLSRGGFHPEPADGVPDLGWPGGPATVLLAGNAGPGLWNAFSADMPSGADPLDRWSKVTLEGIAAHLDGIFGGVRALFPFGGPPYLPFQRWAMRADDVHPSPIGPLIHPVYGLWHAYRGALAFRVRLPDVPLPAGRPSPCDACVERPCLSTCPVDALKTDGYDVPACAGHLADPVGEDCLALGCRARRACPVGRDYHYAAEQARFHMQAFLAARRPEDGG